MASRQFWPKAKPQQFWISFVSLPIIFYHVCSRLQKWLTHLALNTEEIWTVFIEFISIRDLKYLRDQTFGNFHSVTQMFPFSKKIIALPAWREWHAMMRHLRYTIFQHLFHFDVWFAMPYHPLKDMRLCSCPGPSRHSISAAALRLWITPTRTPLRPLRPPPRQHLLGSMLATIKNA